MIFVLIVTMYSTPFLHVVPKSKAIATFDSAHACDVVAERIHRSAFTRVECVAVRDDDDPFAHEYEQEHD